MAEDARDDLRCTFDDASRNHLRDGIRMSTHDKIAFFEEMLLLASRSGALAPERLAARDRAGNSSE